MIWRDALLRCFVAFGVAVVAITEILGAFGMLRRWPLAITWSCVIVAYLRRGFPARPKLHPFETGVTFAIAAIVCIVGSIALISPPNSADAMAYHLPRVVYWAQAGTVAFFPTPYFAQITFPPLAEYMMLHTYLLSGGDRFVNLIQWFGFAGSMVAVSAIAGALGLSSRAQAFAALFCATLPNGILQASGAKNDCLLALWLACAVYFTVLWRSHSCVPCPHSCGHVGGGPTPPMCREESRHGTQECVRHKGYHGAILLGFSVGLALATKSTAYLFLPPIPIAIALARRQSFRGHHAVLAVLAALLINAPQYIRNFRFSGSVLGYDSAQGNGLFRWRNERLGWKPIVSNVLRNASEQLGGRNPRWNQAVYDVVIHAHRAMGLDPQDPDTTWRWTRYGPPRNGNHEADAPNRWHILLLCVATVIACAHRRKTWVLYAGGLVAAFLAFCFYLKWQPFLGRLELPLFVLGSPPAAFLFEAISSATLRIALCFFLLNNARPALFENWTRPLRGPHNLLATSRDMNYFADLGQWNNRDSYLRAVDLTARSGCANVGIDIAENQLEYPFQALLRERNASVRFAHVGVKDSPPVCAVLCLDCADSERKIAEYAGIGVPVRIGRFLLFLRGNHRL